jgi:hypothetical protein
MSVIRRLVASREHHLNLPITRARFNSCGSRYGSVRAALYAAEEFSFSKALHHAISTLFLAARHRAVALRVSMTSAALLTINS